MAVKKKSGIKARSAARKKAEVVETPAQEAPAATQKGRKPTKEDLGRTVQKSFFTTKEMSRALLLAKADHGMTYDAIINEALDLWMKSKGAPAK